MPILFAAVVSVIIAWVRGASPLGLASAPLRWLPLPVLAFAMQAIAFGRFESAAASHAILLQVLSAGLLVAFLLANVRYRALGLVLVGTALNLTVTVASGGYMPVRPADIAHIGFPKIADRLAAEGHFQKSTALNDETRLPWLADVIPLPLPYGPGRMISVGDIFVAAGTFLFIQEALVPTRRRKPFLSAAPATS